MSALIAYPLVRPNDHKILSDLLYLTNPNFKLKYNKEVTKIVDSEDVKFYRKRILQDTKDLLRGNNITEDIQNMFDRFCDELIKYYKFTDKKKYKGFDMCS